MAANRMNCPEMRKPGGCQLHNLHCSAPRCYETMRPSAEEVEREMRTLEDEARARAEADAIAAARAGAPPAAAGTLYGQPFPRPIAHADVLAKHVRDINVAILAASRDGFDVEFAYTSLDLPTGRVTLIDIVRTTRSVATCAGLGAESLAHWRRGR